MLACWTLEKNLEVGSNLMSGGVGVYQDVCQEKKYVSLRTCDSEAQRNMKIGTD